MKFPKDKTDVLMNWVFAGVLLYLIILFVHISLSVISTYKQ